MVKKAYRISDDETIKWKKDGKLYCSGRPPEHTLHLLRKPPHNPVFRPGRCCQVGIATGSRCSGDRHYPYNDTWDSGQAGWIVATKDKLVKESVATELLPVSSQSGFSSSSSGGVASYTV